MSDIQVKVNIIKQTEWYTPSQTGTLLSSDIEDAVTSRLAQVMDGVVKEAQDLYDKRFNELLTESVQMFFEDEDFTVHFGHVDPPCLTFLTDEMEILVNWQSIVEYNIDLMEYGDDSDHIHKWVKLLRETADALENKASKYFPPT